MRSERFITHNALGGRAFGRDHGVVQAALELVVNPITRG